MQHTIELMKNKNQLQRKVVEFIKNADLYMDNFEYVDMDKIQLKTGGGDEKPDEKVLDIPENIMDQIRLVLVHFFEGNALVVEAAIKRMLAFGDSMMELRINITVACIEPAIPDHFVILFGDVTNEPLNEFHSRNRFFYVLFILVPVVMESNHFTVVFINAGSGSHRTA